MGITFGFIVGLLVENLNNMDEAKKFVRWILIQTDEVKYTLSPCRRYKGVIYTIDELYQIYSNLQ